MNFDGGMSTKEADDFGKGCLWIVLVGVSAALFIGWLTGAMK